ncbi:MAG: branched-chain amino acid ABC transporter substrate-binding protein [Chloroflexi bacterium]|nr:branched-chain amino acid ABC transporter substrate-binding protein [Chloroflexota bacterium]
MRRRTAATTIALLAAIFIAACNDSPTQTATVTPASSPGDAVTVEPREPIVIGVSVALSGDQVVVGEDLANAVDLAIADFNRPIRGHAIASRREDDGCNDAEKASAAAKVLAATSNVAGVVGPMCTTGAQAANDVYESAGVIHITPSATRNDLSAQGERDFFRTAWRDDAQAQAQASYALGPLSADTAVVIDDGDPYGRTLADAFIATFEAGGGRVLSRERIVRGTTDFAATGRQIASTEPDVVVFEGFDPEGALLAGDLQAGGFTGTFIGPDSLLNLGDFVVAAGEAAEGAIITGGPVPDEAFTARFTEKYGHAPATAFVLQAYDATRVLLTAIETVAVEGEDGELLIDREQMDDALRSQTFASLTGTIRFDEHGDRAGTSARESGLSIYRVAGGRFELVE